MILGNTFFSSAETAAAVVPSGSMRALWARETPDQRRKLPPEFAHSLSIMPNQ
jgi:hypothetical protein